MQTDTDKWLRENIAYREVYRSPWPMLIVVLIEMTLLKLNGLGSIRLPFAGLWPTYLFPILMWAAYYSWYRVRLRELAALDSEALRELHASLDYPIPNSLLINYLRLKMRCPTVSILALYRLKKRIRDDFGKIVEAFLIARRNGAYSSPEAFFASINTVDDALAAIRTPALRI